MTVAWHDTSEPNDPDHSTLTSFSVTGVRLSCNEIEQLCLKAARGAGMSWGLAEEAGFAAVWLAKRGLDGPGALLAQLQHAAGRPWRDICPVLLPGSFRASDGGCLCPIALGAAICDHAALFQVDIDRAPLRIGPVSHPVLLLPFLSDLARVRLGAVRLAWPEGMVLVSADNQPSGNLPTLTLCGVGLVADLTLHLVISDERPRSVKPLTVCRSVLGELDAFARRTTVPNSDASRSGAGAVGGDND